MTPDHSRHDGAGVPPISLPGPYISPSSKTYISPSSKKLTQLVCMDAPSAMIVAPHT